MFNYDRRGRGESGDASTYAIEREIEDIAALIHEAGESASVFGYSSGALLALMAAERGLPITKLALYEPPFLVLRLADDLAELLDNYYHIRYICSISSILISENIDERQRILCSPFLALGKKVANDRWQWFSTLSFLLEAGLPPYFG